MTRALRPLRLGTAAALAVGALAWSGCAEDAAPVAEEAVVATVGDGVITADAFADAYAQTILRAGTDGPDAAEAVLNTLIHRQLLIEAALDDGLTDSPEFAAARDLAETKALVDLYTAREMADELQVTEADLREAFVQMNTTYEARHLYARDRETAEALRQRIEAGESFEALARETFADSALAASGGSVGAFGYDEMDPAFERAAFELPIGEVSEPVRTATGYSVLRVDARSTRPLLTEAEFDRRRDNLRRYVGKRKRTEVRFALSRATLDDLDPQFESAAFDRLVAFATGREAPLDAEALADWRRQPLVRFSSDALSGTDGTRGVWTVADVEDRAASMTERQRAAVQDAGSLREFIEGLLVRDELAARARATDLTESPLFARIVRDQTEEWVFQEAKRRLRTSVEVPADSARAHFEARRDAYVWPERVAAQEILVASRATADDLLRQLREGADFGALAREHSLRLGAATASGDLGLVTRAQVGRLADDLFAAAPGEIVGPVEVEGRYALLLRGERVGPTPMAFAEARPQIEAELDQTFAQVRLADTVAALRDRYPIEIHPDVMERVLGTLRSPQATAARSGSSSSDRS